MNTCHIIEFKHMLGGKWENMTGLDAEGMIGRFRLMSTDMYAEERKVYYGDEIDLQFWELLVMPIGTPDGDNSFTRQDGYLYQYFHTDRTALYYDETGRLIYQNTDVKSVADLHIDFTIHESHQFEIHIGRMKDFVSWLISARLKRKLYGQSPVLNFERIVYDVPTIEQFCIGSSHDRLYKAKANYHRKMYKAPSLSGLLPKGIDIYNQHSAFSGQIYMDDFVPFKVIRKPMYFTFRSFIPKVLLPWMSMSIYPAIQPTLKPGETQNNRPIYEPWLIQLFNLLFSHPVEASDDDWPVDVLDLSPTFSY